MIRTAPIADVNASKMKIAFTPIEPAIKAPAAGPTTNAVQEAPSMWPFILASRSSSAVRKGANDATAVKTGVPTRPNRKVPIARVCTVSANTKLMATGTKSSSPKRTTLRGSNRSTRTPATEAPMSEATPSAAMTRASWPGVASRSNAALPQMPTKKAASPPTRETKRASTTDRTSRSRHIAATTVTDRHGPRRLFSEQGARKISLARENSGLSALDAQLSAYLRSWSVRG